MKKLLFVFGTLFSLILTSCALSDDNITRFTEDDASETPENTSEENKVTNTPEIPTEADIVKEEVAPIENKVEEKAVTEVKTDAQPVLVEEVENKEKEETTEKKSDPETILKQEPENDSKNEKIEVVEEVAEPQEKEETAPVIQEEKVEEKPTTEEISAKTDGLSVTTFKGARLVTKMNYNLIKGVTPKNTETITINDYKLQKYVPGQTNWSYIASTQFKTLKKGDDNEYVVKALDKDGKQIDSLEFSINYKEIDSHALPDVGTNLWFTIILTITLLGAYRSILSFKK